ncbi:glycosyltransferase family 2 protein [bacterium]|nr:glycosyltransferase family 2 protein [bacterium]
MPARIAAIVPAYNEESTVADVVRALRTSPYLTEIIVVSDGSTDRTADAARLAGATVHEVSQNAGKGAAMFYGAARTDAPVIAFFDADLIGLTADHVERLVLPVLSGSRVMNVGIRDRGRLLSRLAARLPLIGGERVMLRQVMDGVPPEFARGFMVESALNYFCRSRNLPYGTVFLPGLDIRRKYQKVGWKRGVVQYAKMAGQILGAMFVVRVARLFRRF